MQITVPKYSRDDDRGQVGIETLIVFIAMILVEAIAASVLINTAGFLQNQAAQTSQDSEDQVSNQVLIISSIGDVVEVQLQEEEDVEITLTDGTEAYTLSAADVGDLTVEVDGESDTWTTSADYEFGDGDNLADISDGEEVTILSDDGELTLTAPADGEETGMLVTQAEENENQIGEVSMTVMQSPGADEIDLAGASIEYIGPDGQQVLSYEDGFEVDGTQDPDGTAPVLTQREDRFTLSIELEEDGDDLRFLEEGEDATVRITTQSGSEAVTIVNVPQSISSFDEGDAVEL